MTTEYKLNTYIEWTAEDRAKGECPVPKGSDVTVWFEDAGAHRTAGATSYNWGNYGDHITAYLIHSVPREPIVRWLVVGGACNGFVYREKSVADRVVANHGGRVVKLVEDV